MDERRERGLIKLCSFQFSRGGMSGFETWVENYSGSEEKKKYLLKLREVIRIRNGHGASRIDFLDPYTSLKQIITDTFYLSQHLPRDAGGDYLKAKMQELDFNTSPQQS